MTAKSLASRVTRLAALFNRPRRLAALAGVLLALLAGARAALFGLHLARRVVRVVVFRGRRRCPDCAERIRYDARVCVRCGHRLRAAPRTASGK
jgi:hypothetical protein